MIYPRIDSIGTSYLAIMFMHQMKEKSIRLRRLLQACWRSRFSISTSKMKFNPKLMSRKYPSWITRQFVTMVWNHLARNSGNWNNWSSRMRRWSWDRRTKNESSTASIGTVAIVIMKSSSSLISLMLSNLSRKFPLVRKRRKLLMSRVSCLLCYPHLTNPHISTHQRAPQTTSPLCESHVSTHLTKLALRKPGRTAPLPIN